MTAPPATAGPAPLRYDLRMPGYATTPVTPPAQEVFSVSRLNREVRGLLENGLPMLWIEGEISNLARPASGHLYFTLKDDQAQVRCALFRQRRRWLRLQPENGQQVRVRARVTLYEPRGDYQLIVDSLEDAGGGALQRAFEALKSRLAAEGLFDSGHKQALPASPHRIGVVTSPSGAAIRDVISVLKRRYPAISILIYPVPVQGEDAAAEIAAAIRLAGQRRDCDALIVARGGGSLEDLWAFNDEAVARAIHACPIPVVSAVGHETDFTIADFVADVRAPTPSVAAELVSPDREEQLQALCQARQRLTTLQKERLRQQWQRLAWLEHRLQQQHPGQRLQMQAQRLDELEQRLGRGLLRHLQQVRGHLSALQARLLQRAPSRRVQTHALRLGHFRQRLQAAQLRRLEQARERLHGLARELDAVSPLATLARGYAIVIDAGGRVVHQASDVAVGDTVETRLAHGRLRCRVEERHED